MKVDAHPGLQVILLVGHCKHLKEYTNEKTDDGEVDLTSNTRYVEITPGAEFAIRRISDKSFKRKNRRDLVLQRIYLDGEYVDQQYGDPDPTDECIRGVSREINGRWIFRSFTFSGLKGDDLKDLPGWTVYAAEQKQRHLAEVIVKCYWIRLSTSFDEEEEVDDVPIPWAVPQDIKEEDLQGRAISGQTMLQPKAETTPSEYVCVEFPYLETPFATFTFKCRTTEDLVYEGIIPGPTKLLSLDAETMDVEQLRNAFRYAQAQLKKQKDKEDGGCSHKIDGPLKKEPKRVPFLGGRRKRVRKG